MSNKTYNNALNLYETVLRAVKPFINKNLSVDYFVLSKKLTAHFDFPIHDEEEAEDLAEEVIITLNTLGANYIRVYESENNETIFETACYHGGIEELAHLKNDGILENEGVPSYFKEFISLKTKLITKINEERDVIIKLYKSKDDKNTPSPFFEDNEGFVNGRILSALFAAQEIMKEKVNGAIFTNEEYKALLDKELLKGNCLSWFVLDSHSENVLMLEDFKGKTYISIEECFYCAAEQLLEIKNNEKNE